MERERGQYGSIVGGSADSGGISFVKVLAVAFGVTGVLWSRYQGKQIEALYKHAGLPYQGFGEHVLESGKKLTSSAREKLHAITRPKKTQPKTEGV